jgi:PAS domain S-box-containing protein
MSHGLGLAPSHDFSLVAVSIVVAVLASYTALTLAARIAVTRHDARNAWLLGGSVSMGAGIWSMHFVAMLAFRLPVPVHHDVLLIVLSLLVAIAASGLALYILRRDVVSPGTYVTGALVMGGAIAGMHYLGMRGMLVPLRLSYSTPLVALSIAIAVGASGAALRIAHHLRAPDAPWWLRATSAVVMGAAIAGMHYTGMAAAEFTPGAPHHEYAARWAVSAHQLHWPIIFGSILVLGLTLLAAAADVHFRLTQKRILDAEQALRASEERFRSIVESTHEWIWETDARGIVTYTNPASVAVLGVQPTDVQGRELFGRVHSDDRPWARTCAEDAIAKRTGWKDIAFRWHARDGSVKYLESSAVPVFEPSGALAGFRGNMRDVTERKHAETMKSDFVSFVSHQLRTPLSGVSWMLELAAGTPGLSPDVAGYIGEARDSAHRLICLVNDLLDVSRLESGRLAMEPRNLRLDDLLTAVADELRPLVRDKQLQLTVACLATEPTVWADPQLMRQAITNLLGNAIKYTPAGGRIDVTITERDGRVSCAFRDTGIGVPKEAQARLFEKFYRADNAVVVESEGTGLGLSLVRLVVEQFGGDVWCESEPGEGALFTFQLPAVQPTASAVQATAPTVQPAATAS